MDFILYSQECSRELKIVITGIPHSGIQYRIYTCIHRNTIWNPHCIDRDIVWNPYCTYRITIQNPYPYKQEYGMASIHVCTGIPHTGIQYGVYTCIQRNTIWNPHCIHRNTIHNPYLYSQEYHAQEYIMEFIPAITGKQYRI